MTPLKEAAQKALEALEDSIDAIRTEYETDWRHGLSTRKITLDRMKESLDNHEAAIEALRTALAQDVPEADCKPHGWTHDGSNRLMPEDDAKQEAKQCGGTTRAYPLYTHPQRELTHESIAPVRRFLADRAVYLSDETTKKLIEVALQSAQPVAQPLTLDAIKSMDCRITFDEHIRAVRMTEAAHGIGAPQDYIPDAGKIAMRELTDEEIRIGTQAIKSTLMRGGTPTVLPADSWIEKALIAALDGIKKARE